MRKTLAAALIAGMTCLAAAPALAEADGPDYFRVTGVAADDVLNIRAEPKAEAAKLGEIPPDGNGIGNLGCQGGLSFAEWQQATAEEREAAENDRWCRIAFAGVEGWVAGRYLAEGAAPAAAVEAPGHSWRLVSLGGAIALGGAELVFLPDGSLSGSTGCNRFQGRVEVAGTALRVLGPLATTRMACVDSGIAEQEQALLSALTGELLVTYDPLHDRLELVPQGSAPRLALQRAD